VTQRIDVGAVDEFEQGRFSIRVVNGRELGVTCWKNRFFAIRNICPHQQAPLCAGPVLARIFAQDGVGSVDTDAGVPIVVCPWHGWEFQVENGESVWDPDYRVATYAVEVEDGRVLVEVGD
jgi:nitrite reductase (NADH) small subunit